MSKTILILAANPVDTPKLRLEKEVREIMAGLQRSKNREEFNTQVQLASRPIDIRRALLDHKPTIVHFCGHGTGPDGLAVEDESGKAKLIPTTALSNLFELFTDSVECVVLNACFSDVQAQAISRYIPYVVGISSSVDDEAAIEFAVTFYDAIGAGRDYEFAFKFIGSNEFWSEHSQGATPKLRTKAQTLIELNKELNAEDSENRSSSEKVDLSFLEGKWRGEYKDQKGDYYDVELNLSSPKYERVIGRIHWTLKHSTNPSSIQSKKVGYSALEYVKGYCDSDSNTLYLIGYDKDDPYDLIGMDSYELQLSVDKNSFEGRSQDIGTWVGKLFVQRVADTEK